MFGYISPVLSGLSEAEKNRYRALYCGVCHSLSERYGQAARLTLSNDMTFLALLLHSLYEPESKLCPARCGVHPLKAHPYEQSRLIDYAADMNLLLSYYKAVDQVMDEGGSSGRIMEKKLRPSFEKVKALFPEQSGAVRSALEEIWRLEKTADPDPDTLCNLSGRMLGAVFVPYPKDLWASTLYGVGESLGRFVYWMDAVDDLEADRKKRRFNPLNAFYGRTDDREFVHQTLELFIAEAAERFEILPLETDLNLLRNIIYGGVWQRYHQMEKKRTKKAQAGKEDQDAQQ